MRQKRWVTLVAVSFIALGAGIFALRAWAQQPALHAPANASPYYVVTFVDITPDNTDAGAATLKQYVLDLRKAPGMERAEALSQLNRVNHFVLYEVWQNEDAFHKHESSQMAKDFRTKLQPMLGAPFDQRPQFKIE